MRTLLVTDIHGDHEKLEKILEKEDYDAVLCAGDLGDAREYEDYTENLEEVVEEFDQKDKLVKAVPGNMDPEQECVQVLRQHRINLHQKIGSFDGFEAVGYGGGITPFGTPFEPEGEEIKDTLEILKDRMKSERKVAVIHQPPADTAVDIADGEHVGSPEVRELIEDSDFDLLVTGHIHESRGTDSIGDTEIVNPGPVLEGFYAVAEITDDVEVKLKQI
ncbi:MAG: metallophosphoesterase [Candidatus Nanosalina sp.]